MKIQTFLKLVSNKSLILAFLFFLVSLFSLTVYQGFSFSTFSFLLISLIFIFNKYLKKNLNRKSFFLIPADLTLSLIILSVGTNGFDNGIVSFRGILHAISPILAPMIIFISIEYRKILIKSNYKFNEFSKYQSELPFLAIFILLISVLSNNFTFITKFSGFIIPDFVSMFHLSFIISVIIFGISILTNSFDKKTKNTFKQIPILLLFIYILLCKSKILILTSFLIFFIIFYHEIKSYFFQLKRIDYKKTKLILNTYVILIIGLFFWISVSSLNPFLINNLDSKIYPLLGYRNLINNSYLTACKSKDLQKTFPAFTYNQELNFRKIRSLQFEKGFLLNKRSDSVNEFISKGLVEPSSKDFILSRSPHFSFINYYCYHKKIFPFLYLAFIFIFSLFIYLKKGINITAIYILSHSILFFEYGVFFPSFLLTIFLALYFLFLKNQNSILY